MQLDCNWSGGQWKIIRGYWIDRWIAPSGRWFWKRPGRWVQVNKLFCQLDEAELSLAKLSKLEPGVAFRLVPDFQEFTSGDWYSLAA